MKKKIIELGKELGINLKVFCYRRGFDLFDYEVSIDDTYFGLYAYFTGKTNNGILYPKNDLLIKLKNDLLIKIMNKNNATNADLKTFDLAVIYISKIDINDISLVKKNL